MSKLNPEDLVVSTFEVELPSEPDYLRITDPTPDTRCFFCSPTDHSCDSYCLPATGGNV